MPVRSSRPLKFSGSVDLPPTRQHRRRLSWHEDDQMPLKLVEGRDEWWHEAVPAAEASCPVEWMDAEAPLFVLYTSG